MKGKKITDRTYKKKSNQKMARDLGSDNLIMNMNKLIVEFCCVSANTYVLYNVHKSDFHTKCILIDFTIL